MPNTIINIPTTLLAENYKPSKSHVVILPYYYMVKAIFTTFRKSCRWSKLNFHFTSSVNKSHMHDFKTNVFRMEFVQTKDYIIPGIFPG